MEIVGVVDPNLYLREMRILKLMDDTLTYHRPQKAIGTLALAIDRIQPDYTMILWGDENL